MKYSPCCLYSPVTSVAYFLFVLVESRCLSRLPPFYTHTDLLDQEALKSPLLPCQIDQKMFSIICWTICASPVLASTELLSLDFKRAPVASHFFSQRSLELLMYNDIFHQVSVHAIFLQLLTRPLEIYRQCDGWNTATASFSSHRYWQQ